MQPVDLDRHPVPPNSRSRVAASVAASVGLPGWRSTRRRWSARPRRDPARRRGGSTATRALARRSPAAPPLRPGRSATSAARAAVSGPRPWMQAARKPGRPSATASRNPSRSHSRNELREIGGSLCAGAERAADQRGADVRVAREHEGPIGRKHDAKEDVVGPFERLARSCQVAGAKRARPRCAKHRTPCRSALERSAAAAPCVQDVGCLLSTPRGPGGASRGRSRTTRSIQRGLA